MQGKWYQFFHSSRLDPTTNAWCEVILCLRMAGVWHHTYPPCWSLAPFQWNLMAHWCQNQQHNLQWRFRFIVSILFVVVKLILLHLNSQIFVISGRGSQTACPLVTSIVRQQFLLFKGHHMPMGVASTWSIYGFKHHIHLFKGKIENVMF